MTATDARPRSSGLLWAVLVLVLGAFALVVAALVTSRTSWAWGSVAASGTAAGLLVADWVAARHRRPAEQPPRVTHDPRAGQGEPAGRAGDDLAEARHDDGVVDDADPLSAPSTGATADDGDASAADDPADDVPDDTDVSDDTADPADRQPAPPVPEPHVEPAEEHADAADAIAIADLDAIVRVIDERPRYHVASCRWVGDRETIDIELAEARELGFTPCAVCRPDATLAARARRS